MGSEAPSPNQPWEHISSHSLLVSQKQLGEAGLRATAWASAKEKDRQASGNKVDWNRSVLSKYILRSHGSGQQRGSRCGLFRGRSRRGRPQQTVWWACASPRVYAVKPLETLREEGASTRTGPWEVQTAPMWYFSRTSEHIWCVGCGAVPS